MAPSLNTLSVASVIWFAFVMLLAMFGMAGDKFGHRNVLCGMRAVYTFLSAAMTVLAFSGHLLPWHVFLVSALSGMV